MPWRSLMCVLLAAYSLAGDSFSAEIRYHGFPLDSQNDLLVLQESPELVKVGMRSRARPEMDQRIYSGLLKDDSDSARIENAIFWVQIRVQVTKPAGQNSAQSLGQAFRITIDGVDKGPDYHRVLEAPASRIRDVLTAELHKLEVNSTGLESDAMHWAIPVVLGAYKSVGYMPAPLPETVSSTQGSRIAMNLDTLSKRTTVGGRRLGPQPGFSGQPEARGQARLEQSLQQQEPGGPSARAGGKSFATTVRSGVIQSGRREYGAGGRR